MGQPQMQFSTQGFPPGMGGAVPASAAMSGETLPNGGYMGMQQQEAPVPANQGQWSMNQVIPGKLVILGKLPLL